MKASLFIVDDHMLIVEGIRAMLQDEVRILGHACDAASCLAFLQRQQPDVILMDINLPDLSGIALCTQVLDRYPALRIIGLSTYTQLSFITRMLDNGAMGYMLKNATKAEFLSAIDTVMHGRQYLSLDASELLKRADTQEAPVLTRRETEVLQLIAKGLTNAEMAALLFVSPTTIDTHRKHLLEKFNARNTATLIKMAVELSLV